MILVSACLLGINCRYSGGHNEVPSLVEALKGKALVPLCPEQLGGLSTPRSPAEIQGGSGAAVLAGQARVVTCTGEDVTAQFLRGAGETLKLVEQLNLNQAILKARSPSCGVGAIYDGSFTGTQMEGDGVTAALLRKKGVALFTEDTYPSEL